jgi:hypothetical protein
MNGAIGLHIYDNETTRTVRIRHESFPKLL